jgi:transcriptional regulator with XRE-family HTH domain
MAVRKFKVTWEALRVNAGWTVEDVAQMMRVSVEMVEKWERYEVSPTAIQFKKLCGYYRCPMDNVLLVGSVV